MTLLISFISTAFNPLSAQKGQTKNVSGRVIDSQGQPVAGASVLVKGTTLGRNTDLAGKFQITVPANAKTLVISFTGMKEQNVAIAGRADITVQMEADTKGLDEVVVVGYGIQKKESVVAAISTTTNKDLERRGGVTNLASALSGQVPGVNVSVNSDQPGRNDPDILIRGQSTWNSATPLVLVDGIERRMNDISVNEVENITVLKDASATAVFGVKGANGVILVTTKRGKSGKAKLSMSVSNTFKTPSKLTGLMESFSARSWKNAAIEHEVPANAQAWQYYTPYDVLVHFKKPQTEEDEYLYPNEDWASLVQKKFATDQNVNINVSGGTQFAKYFASVSYVHQGDIFNGHGDKDYDPSYTYDRLNFRGNIYFQLTPTTTLSSNLSGYVGQQKQPRLYINYWIFRSIYNLAPDAFVSQYPDGYYGKNPYDVNGDVWNPLASLNNGGVQRLNRLFIGNDTKLDQKLDFITKGLSVNAILSFDNTFASVGPDVNDGSNQAQVIYKYIDPSIKNARTHADSMAAIVYMPSYGSTSLTQGYDLLLRPWTIVNESVTNASLIRALYYRLSLNYARTFNKHAVSALLLFSRNKNATGGDFPSFREDWVGRVTYAYSDKYFVEANGAYNGSEKFGPGHRFGFFPSVGLGWLLSKESFLQKYDWLTKLKLRANIGKVGSDAGIPRWGYLSSWTTGGNANFGNDNGIINPLTAVASPYTSYAEGTIANADINWEVAVKKDIGLELSLFQNKFTLEADYFKDNRSNIFMAAAQRNIPAYFGAPAVPINQGKTETKGFELDMMYRNKFSNGLGYYVRTFITRATDIVLQADDPLLQPDYLKTAGFPIGQTKTQQIASLGNTWNDVYGQTGLPTNTYKLPGDFDIIDYNGDGVIDNFDNIAYGYPNNRPQNTYSLFLGLDYKNFSFMIQFYGVTNMTRNYAMASPTGVFRTEVNVNLGDYWTPEHTDAAYRAPRLLTNGSSPVGNYMFFDASYLRLKTMEIAYQVPVNITKRLGLSNMRFYVNGNNLVFWSKVPDDIETGNLGTYADNTYPQMTQVQIGIDAGF